MTWVKCTACDGVGKIYSFWKDPIGNTLPEEECPTCNGKGRQGFIGALSMRDDWMPIDWRKGTEPICEIRNKIHEDPSQISHDELALEYEKLAMRCELLWKDHCIMQDKIKHLQKNQ